MDENDFNFWKQREEKNRIERKIKKRNRVFNLISALTISGFVGFILYQKYSENSIKNNLSPGSFYIDSDQFDRQYGRAFLKNRDLDSDGKYETVLRYIDDSENYWEVQMILDENGRPKVVD